MSESVTRELDQAQARLEQKIDELVAIKAQIYALTSVYVHQKGPDTPEKREARRQKAALQPVKKRISGETIALRVQCDQIASRLRKKPAWRRRMLMINARAERREKELSFEYLDRLMRQPPRPGTIAQPVRRVE